MQRGLKQKYEDGEALLREGDVSTRVVLLLEGFAKVTASVENGRISILGIRVGGDLVGEMAALEDDCPPRRSATIVACGDLVVRTIPQHSFLAFLKVSRGQ